MEDEEQEQEQDEEEQEQDEEEKEHFTKFKLNKKKPILVFLDLAVTKFLYSVILPFALWPLGRLSL
jgi:hypothetical protein